MRITINFDTSIPEENMEYLRIMKSLDMALCLFKISQLLYKDEVLIDRRGISDAFNEYNINLNEIIE